MSGFYVKVGPKKDKNVWGRTVVACWGRMLMVTLTGVIAVVKGVDESVKYSKSISIISMRCNNSLEMG